MAMPLPGTFDVDYFKGWGLAAVARGFTRVYADEDDRHLLIRLCRHWRLCPGEAEPLRSTLESAKPPYYLPNTYPPLSSYLLGAMTQLYLLVPAPLRPAWLHNVFVKLPVVLAELVAALALYLYVRRRDTLERARVAFVIYWLNPALIVNGASLGYQDAIYIALSFLAVVWALEARVALAALAYLLAVMHKQLALFYLPVVVAILLMVAGRRQLARAALAAAGTAGLIFLPLVVDGRLIGMFYEIATNSVKPLLSATGLNVWWIVTFVIVLRMRLAAGMSWSVALHQLTPLVSTEGSPVRLIGPLLYLGFTLFNLGLFLRRRSPSAAFLAAAMQFYGYAMLMTTVAENHLYGALVFLAALVPRDRNARLLYALLSLVLVSNLALFYGVGLGPRLNRLGLGFDVTVLAAGLNVLVFLWACRVWARGPVPDPTRPEPSLLQRGSVADSLGLWLKRRGMT
jgi:hypothetical protein